jgi:GNAT superfamily N-acetyltransferase
MNKIYSYANMERDLASLILPIILSIISIANNWDIKTNRKYSLVEHKDRKSAKLDRIYLDPEFHGKGIGKVL